MTPSETRKRHFIDSTFHVLRNALHASSFAYYSVDRNYNLYDFVCADVPDDLYRLYIRDMYRIDPLHVSRVAAHDTAVVRMDDAPGYMPSADLVEYTRFMRRHGVVNNIDLIFRYDSEIKAGLSVMWTAGDPAPSARDFRLADDLQTYIEFNLSDHLEASSAVVGHRAVTEFHLTRREADVAKLICAGRTNADIAACLGIGIATVKTHLIHVFDKMGVDNRSGLVARLSHLS